jgi:ATP synthase protein I
MQALADNRQNGPDDLDARISRARSAGQSGSASSPATARGYKQGSRVLAELIGAPLGGALIGWLLDRWFKTSPWCLLVLLALSIVVAFRNIFRIANEKPE